MRRLPLVVGYDGYAPARLLAKRGRNRQLLCAGLAAAPNDAYVWYQLGKDHAAYDEHEQAGQHAEALAQADRYLAHCQDSPDFFFALGDALLDSAAENPAAAAGDLLPLAQTAWMRCLEIGERADQHGSVAGRGSFLAAHNLAALCDGLGATEDAARWRARHPRPPTTPATPAIPA